MEHGKGITPTFHMLQPASLSSNVEFYAVIRITPCKILVNWERKLPNIMFKLSVIRLSQNIPQVSALTISDCWAQLFKYECRTLNASL